MKSRRLNRSNCIRCPSPEWQDSGLVRIKLGFAAAQYFDPSSLRSPPNKLQPCGKTVGDLVVVVPADAQAIGLKRITDHHAGQFGMMPQPNGSADGRTSIDGRTRTDDTQHAAKDRRGAIGVESRKEATEQTVANSSVAS